MIQHNRLHFASMAVELVVHNLEVLHSVVGCEQSLVTVVQSCLMGSSVKVDQVALHSHTLAALGHGLVLSFLPSKQEQC